MDTLPNRATGKVPFPSEQDKIGAIIVPMKSEPNVLFYIAYFQIVSSVLV